MQVEEITLGPSLLGVPDPKYEVELIEEDTGYHPLIPDEPQVFSDTVRLRAWLVGQHLKLDYRYSCRYYQILEELEATMTPDQRERSIQMEKTLTVRPPPVSLFLITYFPYLYPTCQRRPVNPGLSPAYTSVYNVPEFADIAQTSNSSDEVMLTNQVVRLYCIDHRISIQQFIKQFRHYALKNSLNPTMSNVLFYIRYNSVREENELQANLERESRAFDYLNSFDNYSSITQLAMPNISNYNVTMLFQHFANLYYSKVAYGQYYTLNRVAINHDTEPVREVFRKIYDDIKITDNKVSDNNIIHSQLECDYFCRCLPKRKVGKKAKQQRKTVLENIFGVVNKKKQDNVKVGKLIDLSSADIIDNLDVSEVGVENNDEQNDNVKEVCLTEMHHEPNWAIPDVSDIVKGVSSDDSFDLIHFSSNNNSDDETGSSSSELSKDFKHKR